MANENFPFKPKFISKALAIKMYGLSNETIENAQARAEFTFYKPKGTNTVMIDVAGLEKWIEDGKVV